MSDATALERATMYPPYDPAAAVRAYVDEFGALELAGWLLLGITLAVAIRRAPVTDAPLASPGDAVESGDRPSTIVTHP